MSIQPEPQTVANLLEDHGYTWKGYMEDMAAKAPAEPATCRHPGLGAPDNTQSAEVGDEYATRHNPFMYFHSIIDFPTCNQNVVDYSRLDGDLTSAERTPNYSFISPNLCHDGHDDPCVDGSRGGLFAANKWLSEEIPKILASPAFNDNGLLIVTFDEAEGSPPDGDASACCNEQPGPNTPNPGGPVIGPGGGKVGAVLLSPCIGAGTIDETPYNHYSMLRSVEDFFGLPYLGYSGQNGLASFGSRVFTQSSCGGSTGGGDCAKQLIGSRRNDLLQGSADGENLLGKRGRDRIAGNGGPDCLRGGGGGDRLNGGPGIDQFSGGKGRDRIMAVDGVAETVSCGRGRDRAVLDPGDRATRCEKRKVVR